MEAECGDADESFQLFFFSGKDGAVRDEDDVVGDAFQPAQLAERGIRYAALREKRRKNGSPARRGIGNGFSKLKFGLNRAWREGCFGNLQKRNQPIFVFAVFFKVDKGVDSCISDVWVQFEILLRNEVGSRIVVAAIPVGRIVEGGICS